MWDRYHRPFGHVRKVKLGKMKGLGQNQDSGRTAFKELNSGIRSLSLRLAFFLSPVILLKRASLCEIFLEITGYFLTA